MRGKTLESDAAVDVSTLPEFPVPELLGEPPPGGASPVRGNGLPAAAVLMVVLAARDESH